MSDCNCPHCDSGYDIDEFMHDDDSYEVECSDCGYSFEVVC